MSSKTARRSVRYGAVMLAAYPVAFVALTALLIYIALVPIVRPYLDFASLFISSQPIEEPVARNLFTEAVKISDTIRQNEGAAAEALPADATAENETETQEPRIPLGTFALPSPGEQYGRLTIEGTKIDAPIYWDDSPAELNAGIGTYARAWLPGFGRTIMLAGHRNSWLRDLGSAEIGGTITVETHYETYTYEIVDIGVYYMNDATSYDFDRKDENIIIYTCYPFDFIGAAKDRYFVYGDLRTGMQVDWEP